MKPEGDLRPGLAAIGIALDDCFEQPLKPTWKPLTTVLFVIRSRKQKTMMKSGGWRQMGKVVHWAMKDPRVEMAFFTSSMLPGENSNT